MIDEANKIIYYDFSTGGTFQACKEKARLGNVRGWRALRTDLKLDFGHAIHAGWAAYYDALAGGYHDDLGRWIKVDYEVNPVLAAQSAFLRDMGHTADVVVQLEGNERRSLERGMALLRAYITRWKNEPYKNILREDGSPLVEVGFQFHLGNYQEYRIIHVGYIDRIMLNTLTARPTITEGKTTTMALSRYVEYVKPNTQITTYFKPANELMAKMGLPEVRECVWDCMYISDRKPDINKGLLDPFWNYGVDKQADFTRAITTRSKTDVTEMLTDAESVAIDYAKWLLSGARRWPRNTGSCHQYSGCQFRNRCTLNLDEIEEEAYMATFFKIDKWEPWRKIVLGESNA